MEPGSAKGVAKVYLSVGRAPWVGVRTVSLAAPCLIISVHPTRPLCSRHLSDSVLHRPLPCEYLRHRSRDCRSRVDGPQNH